MRSSPVQNETLEFFYIKPTQNEAHISLLFIFRPLPSGTYMLQNASLGLYPVYCHMTEIVSCGAGEGWTLAMTMDGNLGKTHQTI